MKRRSASVGMAACAALVLFSSMSNAKAGPTRDTALQNKVFRLTAGPAPTGVTLRLHDLATRFDLANGPYRYRLSQRTEDGLFTPTRLKNVSIQVQGDRLIVSGMLGVLKIEQVFTLPKDKSWMEERIRVQNTSKETVELTDFEFGFTRLVSDTVGTLAGSLKNDRFVAVPFRHRPNDEAERDIDLSIEDLKKLRGRERQTAGGRRRFGFFPADQWASDGWAWQHGPRTFGVFKFNQEAIEFTTLALQPIGDRLFLRFGGAAVVDDEPGCLKAIPPGATIDLGATRYVSIPGDYTQAYYAYRGWLDQQGCRFPKDYNPPVQWNELYDNPEWHISAPPRTGRKQHLTRRLLYTRDAMEKEAHCRANLELARRVHAKHPDVLIEMHDMMLAGKRPRYLPVYYKYGLPGSYDETWGFEFMWNATDDIRSGHARSLYYYNLACNIPLYLHIDLRDDNLHCQTLWWYASTCRHLGLGGTHNNPMVVQAQQAAMKKYRELDRYFKRGDFYGVSEEIHAHVLPEENALVINVFNLSGESRTVTGQFDLRGKDLDLNRWYTRPKGCTIDLTRGLLTITRRLEPWACEVLEVKSYPIP
ncbi:MAG: hypothetical protein JW818_19190 [Pirellulales bacterium]|nr:hypothetical protein [Pirellulales bacterium]